MELPDARNDSYKLTTAQPDHVLSNVAGPGFLTTELQWNNICPRYFVILYSPHGHSYLLRKDILDLDEAGCSSPR